jgi:glycosyltransferase involved in cell wall biosynthesis
MSLPPWCQSALLVGTVASAIAWIAAGLAFYSGSRRIGGLTSVEPLPDAELPPVTIVSAARNEAARIGAAARSLLAQDAPRLEVIAVDDRSEDATGAILDGIAAEDGRLTVLHVTQLPEGWLGKCHALALGAAAASGEWLLFTDGDVSLAPDAVRRAVSYATRHGADHVAVSADFEVHGLGEAIFVSYFVSVFNVSQRPWDAPDPRSGAHIGIGAFNLVRRDAYVRSGGHTRLRMELLDDMGLGLILKTSGSRSMLAGHDGLVRARWQEGLGGLIRGVEKNAFPALGYDPVRAGVSVALLMAVSVLPAAGILATDPWTRAAAIVAWSGVVLVYSITARSARTSVGHAVCMPVGALLFGYSILASMFAILARGGVVWRGTFYPLAQLRAGRVWAMGSGRPRRIKRPPCA